MDYRRTTPPNQQKLCFAFPLSSEVDVVVLLDLFGATETGGKMADDANTRLLYQIRRTLMEMLSDRGYMVSEKEKTMTFDDFRDKFGVNPTYDFRF